MYTVNFGGLRKIPQIQNQFPIKPNPTPPTKTPSSTSTPSSSLQLQWGFKYSLNSIQGIAYPDNGKWVLLERGKPYTNTYFTNAEYDWIQFFFSMKAGKEGTYKGGRLLTVSIPDGKILYQNTKAEWTFTQKKYLPSATIGGGMITNNGKKIPAMTSITVEYTHNSFHP